MKTLIKLTIIIAVISCSFFSAGNSKAVTTTLNVKCLLQGHVYSTLYPIPITVSLYTNAITPVFVESATTTLTITGNATALFTLLSGTSNYFIKVGGWNILPTWSKTAQSITAGGSSSYDFSTLQTQAFGDNLVALGSDWALYTGDLPPFGSIGLVDIIGVWADVKMFVTGSVTTDVNGDGIVDNLDLLIVYNNSAAFVAEKKP